MHQPRLKAEFDRQGDAAQDNGQQPDPGSPASTGASPRSPTSARRLADRDREISEHQRARFPGAVRLVLHVHVEGQGGGRGGVSLVGGLFRTTRMVMVT